MALVTVLAAVLALSAWSPAIAIAPPTTTTTLPPVPAAELPVFQLPYATGSAYRVSQGNAGAYTHLARGPSEFAWDFLMGEGTMVVAARAGRVVAIEAAMSGAGVSDAYGGHANYVLIAHPGGLYSLYVHLATAGVLVSPGQWVEAGEGIALSGNTGFSSGPHLHFQVQGAELPASGQSLPVAFAGVGVPQLWARPVSTNGYLSPNPAPKAELGPFVGVDIAADARPLLLTHQLLPVAVRWASPEAAPGGTPGAAGGSALGLPAPLVRIRTVDAAGAVRVVASGVAAAGAPLEATVSTPTPGWMAVWAEYFDGSRWRVCADVGGRPVAAAYDVGAASVFLAEPGLTVRTMGADGSYSEAQVEVGAAVGEVVRAEFRVENVGEEAIRLLDVGAELEGPAGAISSDEGGSDLYLRPGESGAWVGSFRPSVAGTFVVRPVAQNAAGKDVALQPRRVGDPATVRVVVRAPGAGPGNGGPGDGEGGGEGGGAVLVFADLPAEHPAHDAAQMLAARGLVVGYLEPDGRRTFRPEEPVMRAQFAKLLVGTLGLPVAEGGPHPFLDVQDSGPGGFYPDDYIAAALSAGLLRGVSEHPPRFAPYSPLTRHQVEIVSGRAGLDGAPLSGDQWAPASRGEVAMMLARFLAGWKAVEE